MDASGVLVSLAVFANVVVTGPLVVTVGSFAGAALAHFRTNGKPPSRPTEADAGGPPAVGRDASKDDSDVRSSTVR